MYGRIESVWYGRRQLPYLHAPEHWLLLCLRHFGGLRDTTHRYDLSLQKQGLRIRSRLLLLLEASWKSWFSEIESCLTASLHVILLKLLRNHYRWGCTRRLRGSYQGHFGHIYPFDWHLWFQFGWSHCSPIPLVYLGMLDLSRGRLTNGGIKTLFGRWSIIIYKVVRTIVLRHLSIVKRVCTTHFKGAASGAHGLWLDLSHRRFVCKLCQEMFFYWLGQQYGER